MGTFQKNIKFVLNQKPGRYINGEWNLNYLTPENAEVKILLAFPDVYEIGTSYFGYNILYQIASNIPNVLVDRIFAPWIDFESFIKSNNYKLSSIHHNIPLNEFDIIGFTLQYELNYTNILNIIKLGGLEIKSSQRKNTFPIIIGGGEGALSPEPLSEFLDCFVAGDGEEVFCEIISLIKNIKKNSSTQDIRDKDKILHSLAKIDGIYVPKFFSVSYNEDNRLSKITANIENIPTKIKRRITNFSYIRKITKPIIPLIRIPHDRFTVEIKRGCGGGCRFCRAGMIGRPVRERSPEEILSICREGIANTGYDEIGLLSLSSTDHSQIKDIIEKLQISFKDLGVSLAIPSTRINDFDIDLLDKLSETRKSGLTFAPEAGSQRLRNVINKSILNDKIFSVIESALVKGWQTIKLYFMIGLPTENYNDIEEMTVLINEIFKIGKKIHGKKFSLNVTISPFIPKPHTPFQWEGFSSEHDLLDKIKFIKSKCGSRQISIKHHHTKQSLLEAVISRGDRNICKLIEKSFMLGAKLDAWEECFDFYIWQRAADELGLSLQNLASKKYSYNDTLPWEMISGKIASKEFLWNDYQRALKEEITETCMDGKCVACGVCTKDIKPLYSAGIQSFEINEENNISDTNQLNYFKEPKAKLRLHYTKKDKIRFVSHLDIVRLMKLILRRSCIPIVLTKGFNPQPKIQFSKPLALGYESEDEIMDCFISEEIISENLNLITAKLNEIAPDGIKFYDVSQISTFEPSPEESFCQACVEVVVPSEIIEDVLAPNTEILNICLNKLQSPSILNIDNYSIFQFYISLSQNKYIDPLRAVSEALSLENYLTLDQGVKVNFKKRIAAK